MEKTPLSDHQATLPRPGLWHHDSLLSLESSSDHTLDDILRSPGSLRHCSSALQSEQLEMEQQCHLGLRSDRNLVCHLQFWNLVITDIPSHRVYQIAFDIQLFPVFPPLDRDRLQWYDLSRLSGIDGDAMKPCLHDLENVPGCRVCFLYANDPAYRRLWDGGEGSPEVGPRIRRPLFCLHLGRRVHYNSCRCPRLDHRLCDRGHGIVQAAQECEVCPDYLSD